MKTPLAYIYREGNRTVEIAAACESDALAQLPALVAATYPGNRADYWQAFAYCGTMPAQPNSNGMPMPPYMGYARNSLGSGYNCPALKLWGLRTDTALNRAIAKADKAKRAKAAQVINAQWGVPFSVLNKPSV